MGLLIRIQKKLENKLLHKHGEHGKPVYYADPADEVEETTTPRTSTSGPTRPTSRLNLSFLSSTRRNSTQQAQSANTDTPPRSPSFFCRGSSAQPNARRSLHARNGSNLSATGRRSGTWPHGSEGGQSFRLPAFPDSGYVSRESDPDIGFLPEGDEPLASPSQMGNAMTLGRIETTETNGHHSWRGVPSDPMRGVPGPPVRGFSGATSTSGIAERYEAPSAMSPNEDLVNGEDSTATATGGLRGFEGDRDGFFTPLAQTVERERPVQPARTQTAAPAIARPAQPARTQTDAPAPSSGDGGRTMRMQIDDARRQRRPFTTTRALTGYAYVKGEL